MGPNDGIMGHLNQSLIPRHIDTIHGMGTEKHTILYQTPAPGRHVPMQPDVVAIELAVPDQAFLGVLGPDDRHKLPWPRCCDEAAIDQPEGAVLRVANDTFSRERLL